jgi:hypothetical protein
MGLGISMNVTGRDEHVPEVERYIRTLKERIRSVYNTLPFKTIPRNMLVELVKYANFWLNSFPKEDGIFKTLSPRTMVTGQLINYLKTASWSLQNTVRLTSNTTIPWHLVLLEP